MIRAVHIVSTLQRGGAEKQLTLLARGLPRDRFDVHVITLTGGGPLAQNLTDAGIPVSDIGRSWTIDPPAFQRLRKQIRRLRPDIVHTWLFEANCYGRKAALAERVPHLVAAEQRVDVRKPWRQLVLDRSLAKRTDRIATNSPCIRDFYVKQRIAAEKFTVISNGVPPFEPDLETSREDLLDDLGLPPDSRLLAAIGRLEPSKRLKDLIWTTDLLRNVRDDARLLIIGDGPHRPRLERYAEQCEPTGRVHFLGPRDDVPRLLTHVDCFCIGSRFEGQSNALMEAMSAGIPVVASDIPGNRDLVVPHETGYLVRVGDRAGFARWTNLLLDDKDAAKTMGENGRRRMLNHFSVEEMLRRYIELYDELAQA